MQREKFFHLCVNWCTCAIRKDKKFGVESYYGSVALVALKKIVCLLSCHKLILLKVRGNLPPVAHKDVCGTRQLLENFVNLKYWKKSINAVTYIHDNCIKKIFEKWVYKTN